MITLMSLIDLSKELHNSKIIVMKKYVIQNLKEVTVVMSENKSVFPNFLKLFKISLIIPIILLGYLPEDCFLLGEK